MYKLIHIIISTYKQPEELKLFNSCLKLQNQSNYIPYYVDDDFHLETRLLVNSFFDTELFQHYFNTEERTNDYGHSGRAMMLENLKSEKAVKDYDYILFTNADNYYVPAFISEINKVISNDNPEIVYWDMIHSHNRGDSSSQSTYGYFNTEFLPCKCDIGAFIVRVDIAKQVGFNHRDHDADAHFIEEINRLPNIRKVKINKVLFVHN